MKLVLVKLKQNTTNSMSFSRQVGYRLLQYYNTTPSESSPSTYNSNYSMVTPGI